MHMLTKDRSPAGKLIRTLAEQALWRGPNGFGNPSDCAKRVIERVRSKARWGEPVEELPFEARPGAFIQRQSPEKRAILRTLTSDDVADVTLDPQMHDYEQHPEPGKVYKFGMGAAPLADAPTMWKIPGNDPDRQV